jgi:hypothetical protein
MTREFLMRKEREFEQLHEEISRLRDEVARESQP